METSPAVIRTKVLCGYANVKATSSPAAAPRTNPIHTYHSGAPDGAARSDKPLEGRVGFRKAVRDSTGSGSFCILAVLESTCHSWSLGMRGARVRFVTGPEHAKLFV